MITLCITVGSKFSQGSFTPDAMRCVALRHRTALHGTALIKRLRKLGVFTNDALRCGAYKTTIVTVTARPTVINKVSPRGRRDEMPPPADGNSTVAYRFAANQAISTCLFHVCVLIIFCLFLYFVCVFFKLLFPNFALAVDCCINCMYQ